MSNAAITNISAALGYDAVEVAIMSSFSAACAAAAYAYSEAPLGDDTAPESCRTVRVTAETEAMTVRPSSK